MSFDRKRGASALGFHKIRHGFGPRVELLRLQSEPRKGEETSVQTIATEILSRVLRDPKA